MARKIRLGIIVPSSNTALEPITQAIVSSVHDVSVEISVHFSRFRVTQISLSAGADAQFDLEIILAAARLLADAKVDAIGWSGTSAGWLGFERDEKLCAAIMSDVNIPATTSTLALNRLLHRFEAKKFALVTPYVESMNDAIRANYARIGVTIDKVDERHLGITDNLRIAEVGEATLDSMIESVASNGSSIVSTFCTNLHAAQRVDYWEKTHGVVVLDTVSTVVWDLLRIVGIDPRGVRGWGKMFAQK